MFCFLAVLVLLCASVSAESAREQTIITLGETTQEVTDRIGSPDVVVFSGKSDAGKDKTVWLYEKFIDDPVKRLDETRWAFGMDYGWGGMGGPLEDPFFDPGERIEAQDAIVGEAPAPLDRGFLFTFIEDKLVSIEKQS